MYSKKIVQKLILTFCVMSGMAQAEDMSKKNLKPILYYGGDIQFFSPCCRD